MSEDWDQIADDENEWAGEPIVDTRSSARTETVVSVRMPLDLADQARRLARVSDLSLSAFVRALIESAVKDKLEQRVYSLDVSRQSNVSTSSSSTGGSNTPDTHALSA